MEEVPSFGDAPPVLVADEPDPARPDDWLIHAYFEHAPSEAELAALAALGSGEPLGRAARRGGLGDDEPGRARSRSAPAASPSTRRSTRRSGARSISRSTPASPSAPASTRPPAAASRRSTGSSARARASPTSPTSAPAPACSPSPRWRCGPRRKCIATDIDAVAVEVARDNAAINGVRLGHGAGELLLAEADGMESPLLAARAPFDLIVANILAGPLIALAPDFARGAGAGRHDRPRRPARHAGRGRSPRLMRAVGLTGPAPSATEWPVLVLGSFTPSSLSMKASISATE